MRIKPIIRGLLTYVPPLERLITKSTGGTDTARYCYSVWLRHLVMAGESGLDTRPGVVAELGPGDSLGLGLCALLSGSNTYYGFDIVEYADVSRSLSIFDELAALFRAREPIPDSHEYPDVKPNLPSYDFPGSILTEARLDECLSDERIGAIRAALEGVTSRGAAHAVPDTNSTGGITMAYRVPWFDPSVVEPESVDMVFSQAVLEHVDDLETTYRALARWLKPGGVASHEIGFVSHKLTPEWNGHWTIPGREWKLIRGRRPYLLNREPASTHVRLIRESGLDLAGEVKVIVPSGVERGRLAGRFREMSDEDLTTLALFVQARKPREEMVSAPNHPAC